MSQVHKNVNGNVDSCEACSTPPPHGETEPRSAVFKRTSKAIQLSLKRTSDVGGRAECGLRALKCQTSTLTGLRAIIFPITAECSEEDVGAPDSLWKIDSSSLLEKKAPQQLKAVLQCQYLQ